MSRCGAYVNQRAATGRARGGFKARFPGGRFSLRGERSKFRVSDREFGAKAHRAVARVECSGEFLECSVKQKIDRPLKPVYALAIKFF